MTVLNFPDDPASVDNTYIAPNGVTYYYDGVKWVGRNSANVQITRWDATPTVPGNNCPIFAELTPNHFYAYTQQSHLELDNDGHWYVGSNANATGLYGLNNDTTLYSSRGNVVIRTGENDLKYFTFTGTGGLQFPDGSIQATAYDHAAIIDETAPTDPRGKLWFNSTDGRMYINIYDEGTMWVDTNPVVVPPVSTYLDGLVVEGTTIATTEINAAITVQNVEFGADGVVHLPVGGDIVDSTGNSVLVNENKDRLVNGTNSLVLGADGKLTLPGTRGSISSEIGTDLVISNQGTGATLSWSDGIFVPNTTPVSSITVSDAGATIETTTDSWNTSNVWTFNNNGNLIFPEYGTIRSQPSSSVSIESDQYTDIAWFNPAIFDPDTSSFDNLNAGDAIGNAVGVDQDGAYLSVIVANTDGATSATVGTWGVNTDGNLFTERFTQGLGSGGTTELPPGDIIDLEGNSLVYVPTTDTAPSHDHNGLLWFNTEDGRAYIRYNHQWVDANPPVVAPVSAYLDGLAIEGQTISSTDYVESAVKIGGDLVPDEDLTYNLGSPTKQWKHLYVDSHTIYMGGKALSLTNQGLEVDGRTAIYEIDGGVASTWLTV